MKFKLSKKDIAKSFEIVFEIKKKKEKDSVTVLESLLPKLETFCNEESWKFLKLRSELLFFLGDKEGATSNLNLSTVSLLFLFSSVAPSAQSD